MYEKPEGWVKPVMTPEELRDRMERVINVLKGRPEWDKLPWYIRKELNGFSYMFDEVIKGLKDKPLE